MPKTASNRKPVWPDELDEVGQVDPPAEPIFDYILVRRLNEQPDMTPGGLHIPDTAKGKPLSALVIAVGPGGYGVSGALLPMHVKAGQTVLIGRFAGHEVELDGVEYVLIAQRDVLGILKPGTVVG